MALTTDVGVLDTLTTYYTIKTVTFYFFISTTPEKNRSENKSTRTFASSGVMFFMAVAVSARELSRRRRGDTLAVIATKIEDGSVVGMLYLSGCRKWSWVKRCSPQEGVCLVSDLKV